MNLGAGVWGLRSVRRFVETLAVSGPLLAGPAFAADRINGQVLGAGAPIANSIVTLWAASAGAPKELAQARTGADGRFTMKVPGARGASSLYLVAQRGRSVADKGGGDNPRIALMTVLGPKPPAKVTINEMTTVASVCTHAQFLDGTAIQGHALGLRIAAGNVPNFVDLTTGGWGGAIQDPLNSSQTPTMANFATLADLISACVTRVTADACEKLLEAAAPPKGSTPTDTLMAAQSIARYPWYQPQRLFALLDVFYPVPTVRLDGQPRWPNLRAVPYMPYLNWAPSALVLPLKFDGGGYRAGGKAMFDSEGNLWVGNNFTIGAFRRALLPDLRRTPGGSGVPALPEACPPRSAFLPLVRGSDDPRRRSRDRLRGRLSVCRFAWSHDSWELRVESQESGAGDRRPWPHLSESSDRCL